jgi:predicted metal-dependent hydrolase
VPEALTFGDPEIEVTLRRNTRARRLVLRVARDGRGPTLTVPPGVNMATARAFLAGNEIWLRDRLAAAPASVAVADGTVLPFGDRQLTVRASEGRRMLAQGGALLVPGPRAQLPVRVQAWMREAARAALCERVAHYAALLGRRPGRLTLRDPRSRWGSCASSGDLMVSWRLVMAPEAVRDYVAAHEVAHLVEMNHAAPFWCVVRRLCPGFETPRAWLRANGAGLHAYDFGGP